MILYICDLCHDYQKFKMAVFLQEEVTPKYDLGFGGSKTVFRKELHICWNCLDTKFSPPSVQTEDGGITKMELREFAIKCVKKV